MFVVVILIANGRHIIIIIIIIDYGNLDFSKYKIKYLYLIMYLNVYMRCGLMRTAYMCIIIK